MSIYRYYQKLSLLAIAPIYISVLSPEILLAQTVNPSQIPSNLPTDINRKPEQPQNPSFSPEKLPELPATPTPPASQIVPSDVTGTIEVKNFQVEGSTVFSKEELDSITTDFTNKSLTFGELLKVADAITKLYVDKGYITSGAFIPVQSFQAEGGVVKIQVVEGRLESIQVRGTGRLNPDYVRSRIDVATGKIFNINKLLDALRLLQLDPQLKNISGELAAGIRPGTSILDVTVIPAKTFSAEVSLDNNRSSSIGSFQRQIQLKEANLLGLGDGLSFAYGNTDGSNSFDVNYTLPVNPQNGTLRLNYSNSSSRVIGKPFDVLDISGNSQEYGVTFRQPIIQTPTEELALGVTATRRESQLGFLEGLIGERIPYPAPGADKDGETKLSVVRFFQDWTQRSTQQVISARSQFSLGVNAFNSTINEKSPDSEFFAWRGQAQFVKLLAPDTLLVVRGDLQLADRALLPSEQIGVGGQATVRGYRQDFLLADNGFLASAEFRYPILRVPKVGVLQIIPFFDYGAAWNTNNADRSPLEVSNISSTGLGLLWQQERLAARLDWGIPLTSVSGNKNNWQENGLYFSVTYNHSF